MSGEPVKHGLLAAPRRSTWISESGAPCRSRKVMSEVSASCRHSSVPSSQSTSTVAWHRCHWKTSLGPLRSISISECMRDDASMSLLKSRPSVRKQSDTPGTGPRSTVRPEQRLPRRRPDDAVDIQTDRRLEGADGRLGPWSKVAVHGARVKAAVHQRLLECGDLVPTVAREQGRSSGHVKLLFV